MEEKMITTFVISREARRWLEIYKARRGISNLGEALESLIEDRKTNDFEKSEPIPADFLRVDDTDDED